MRKINVMKYVVCIVFTLFMLGGSVAQKRPINGEIRDLYVMSLSDPEAAKVIVDSLFELSKKENFKRYEEKELLFLYGSIYRVIGDKKRAIEYFEKSYGMDIGNVGRKLVVYNTIGNLCMLYAERGEIEKAMSIVNEGLEMAKKDNDSASIASFYTEKGGLNAYLSRFSEGEEDYDIAIEIISKMRNQLYNKHLMQMKKATRIYARQEMYQEAADELKKVVDELENTPMEVLAQSAPYDNINMVNSNLLMAYSCLVKTLSYMSKYEEAKPYADKAIALNEKVHIPTCDFYNGLTTYLNGKGEYEKTIEIVDLGIEVCQLEEFSVFRLSLLSEKAIALKGLKRFEDANSCLNEIIRVKDTLSERMAREANIEKMVLYETAQKDCQIEQQHNEIKQQRLWILIVVTVLILSVIMIVIYVYYARRIKRKNVVLYKQIVSIGERERRFAELRHCNNREEDGSDVIDSADDVFEKIQEYIDEKKPYLDPNFSRAEMLKEFSINEKYLAVAVRNTLGLTLQAYIQKLRVDYAKGLLMDRSNNSTISEIAYSSGFTNLRTFNRLFQNELGLTPSEFRNMSRMDI